MARDPAGAVALSVDLTSLGAEVRGGSRSESAVVKRLLELLDLYELPVTWAMAEPATHDAVGWILAAETPHHFALLGDVSWVGAAAGRPRFARELGRRVVMARDFGLTIDALLSPTASVPREHFDLLVKHDLIVVRQPRASAGRTFAALQPRPLRHGIWEAPATATLPRGDVLFGKGAGAARRTVRQAVGSGGVAHLRLDVAMLAAFDARLSHVENVFRHVARHAGHGLLRTATLGALAREWVRPPSILGARSILRAA